METTQSSYIKLMKYSMTFLSFLFRCSDVAPFLGTWNYSRHFIDVIVVKFWIVVKSAKKRHFIGFLFRFTCLYGKKFVSKSDFAVGSSANLLTELTAVCLISGWFNETVGSYTCVKDCGPPTNYSTVMTNNWDGNLTVVPYGKSFK